MPIGTPTSQSDFVANELLMTTMTPRRDAMQMALQAGMKNRRLWGYIIANNSSTTDWFLQATIRFYLSGTNVGELPLEEGLSASGSTLVPRTLSSVATGSSNPVANDLFVTIANPAVGATDNYYLTPFDYEINADLVTVSVNAWGNVTQARIYLAVQSWS